MADLNLVSTPPFNVNGLSLSASRNPIQFRFETDTIGSANYAYCWIWVQGPSIAATTPLTFNGKTYTASNDPAFGQYLTTTAHTTLEVCQSIVLMLADDPDNYEYEFSVITSGFFATPTVFATAKQPGSAYDITLAVGTGLTILGNFSGTDQYRGQSLDNYKVWAELYTNDAFGFAQYLNTVPAFSPGNRLLAYYPLVFNQTNQMTFDVFGTVDTQVGYQSPDTAVGIHLQTAPTKAFFIQYGESFTPAGMENELRNIKGKSNVFYAVNSALATLAPNVMARYIARQPIQAFLTDQPLTRSVRTTDTTWLSFIHYSPNGSQRWIGAFIQAVFYDETSATVGTRFITQMSNGYHTMRIDPLSWNMAGYESTSGKLVKRYDVYLMESLNAGFTGAYKFSELRSFVIDRLCQSTGMIQFAWLETIGGWAGFSFFGEILTDIERAARVYDRGRAVDYSPSDQMMSVQEVDYSFVNSAFSGTVDQVTYQWLRDSILKSVAVYIIASGVLIPIVITGHSAKSSTEDFTYSLGLTFTLSAPVNGIAG